MKAYPISGDNGWSMAAAVEIAKAFAITGLYKNVDSFPILIVLRLPTHSEVERQLRPTKDVTLEALSKSIEAALVSLLPRLDPWQSPDAERQSPDAERQSPDTSGPVLLFFWSDHTVDHTAGALAEIDFALNHLSIHPEVAGLPESLHGSFTDAMSAIADQMDRPIGLLSLVKNEQWPKMLVRPPDHSPYFEYRLPLITYLRQAIRRFPGNIAYVYGDDRLTYSELDAASDGLAAILKQQGVTKGDLVFIALDNSIELPVSYIACMKLGAAFTPADVQWPDKRFRELAESIRPKAVIGAPGGHSWSGGVLITGSAADWQASSGTSREKTPQKTPQETPQESPQGMPQETQIGAEDLLYGFFTSGSTGVPKCTLNTQKGVVNRFMYMDKVFGIRQESDVILQNSNTSFDSSLWQLLWPLMSGCKIVIPRRKSYLDFEYTLNLIAKHRVTMTDFVPSVFSLMLYKLEANPRLTEMLTSVKALIVGGEASQAKFITRFYRLCPWISLVNTYGHTEASIGMVFYPIPRDFNETEVPLGLPIDNTYVILLDQQKNPVPPGFTGEVYVGGCCIGAGYYNDPDKNAKTFLPNPFAFIPGDKIYRTGDFGRLGSNGLLYYKGRNDDQIKIGGARLDLGEIEQHCLQVPGVERVKILFETENQKLVAFVAARDTGEVFKAQLLQSLKDRLPAYAVPSQLFLLDTFPLTANGKVDMLSLKRSIAATGKREPQPFAREIRKLFRESLGIEDLNDEANFFSNGGTSLTALKLILDIESLLHVSIDLEKVYHELTIRKLIVAAQGTEQPDDVPVSADEVKLMLTDYTSLANAIHRPATPDQDARKKDIFLTGASGYLGVQLLSELLERSTTTIHCLMRGGNEEHAYERIARRLAHYELPCTHLTRDRVRIVTGDLTRENWGMTAAAIQELKHSVGIVIHNAADVDMAKNYSGLRLVNVSPIKFLIDFCTSGSLVHLHYISTISIFSDELFTHYDVVPDKILYDFDYIPSGGYNQSKWISEKVLVSARNKGLPLSIYRLGEIAPNSGTGIANERSLLAMLIQSILYLKAYPDSDLPLDYFPADLAGELIVQSVLEAGKNADTNMVNVAGISINQVAELIMDQGIALEKLSYGVFKKRLDAAAPTAQDTSPFLYVLKFLLPAETMRNRTGDPLDIAFFKYLNRISDFNLSKRLGSDRFRLNSHHAYIERLAKACLSTLPVNIQPTTI